MEYPETLRKAQTLLEQGHGAQAVQTAASALENLLVELYNQLLGQSPPARQRTLIEAQEKVGGGQPLNRLTLGKLVGIYRASQAYEDLKKLLGRPLVFLNVAALDPIVDIRNRAVHEGHEPYAAEAAYVVNQVELILREAGKLPAVSPVQERRSEAETPWWHIAMPHRDIREGRMDLKVFAIDLAQVIEGDAVPEYRDAETFFKRTFLTRGLRSTVRGVLRRLAGEDDGTAITQMATVFGGGKTHTLLTLYHMVVSGNRVKDVEPVTQLLAEAELGAAPAARFAAIDCAHIGPEHPRRTREGLTLRTLWGELAYRLGGDDRAAEFYEIVRASDEARVAPGSETLERLFKAAGPSLILIDETLAYITKASGVPVGRGYLSEQAQEFLLELTRAVNATDNIALVLTMTSSEQEQLGGDAMRVAQEIDKTLRILRRTRQVEVSAEREELYEILRRRLFDSDPDIIAAQARPVAQEYWDYYRQHENDFPREVQSPEYRDLMVRAYPFHPALIELLRDRWGSISGFQRTRGVLRLLALVVGNLYARQRLSPMIQPAHVDLDDGEIRNEFLEYVDNRGDYESAVLSDIGGSAESKAPMLDRITGGDYARHRIAAGLATSVFLYSHSGATQRSASAERPQLWLAALQPGIVPALAADALDKLQRRLWYLVVQEGTYRIDSQPNLNQMLVSRIDAIRQEPEKVHQRLREAVEEVAGAAPFSEVRVWPSGPLDVPGHARLTLVALDPSHAWGQGEREQGRAQSFVQGILKSAGNTFRQNKNTLVFVLPTAESVRLMEDAAVNLLALEAIYRQYRPLTPIERGSIRRANLSELQTADLETRLDRARKGLPGAVWGAYTIILAPSARPRGQENASDESELWLRQEHGFAGYRPGEHTLAKRVWARLMDDQRLLDRLDPRLITEGKGGKWRLWPADEETINVATLWDYFCRFPYLPMLTGAEALQNTIQWGVQRSLFAYALGDAQTFDTIRFGETLPTGAFGIGEGAWLLRPALAQRLLRPREPEVIVPPVTPADSGQEPPRRPTGGEVAPTPQPRPPARTMYTVVTIETPVDWRQWYDFYQSVVRPLVEAGAEIRLQLRLEATGEIDANLVDLSVRESVIQLNRRGTVDAH